MRHVLLFIVFFIDVRVHAAEAKDCWGKKIPCAVFAGEGTKRVSADSLSVVLHKNALLEQRSEDTVQLVDGRFYIETGSASRFKTPYGEFQCLNRCKAIVSREETELNLQVLAGSFRVRRTGEKRDYEVAAGLQVKVSEVTDSGVAHMEFPQALPWEPVVKEWAKVYPGSKAEFKTDIKRFRADWRAAVESASQVHFQQASRMIASHESDLANERARQKAREREDAQLRELFRKKALGFDP